jgi:hypothetical protein
MPWLHYQFVWPPPYLAMHGTWIVRVRFVIIRVNTALCVCCVGVCVFECIVQTYVYGRLRPAVLAVCPNTGEVWIFAGCKNLDPEKWKLVQVLKKVSRCSDQRNGHSYIISYLFLPARSSGHRY